MPARSKTAATKEVLSLSSELLCSEKKKKVQNPKTLPLSACLEKPSDDKQTPSPRLLANLCSSFLSSKSTRQPVSPQYPSLVPPSTPPQC